MSLVHDLAAKALRRIDPEEAHRLTIRGLKTGFGPRGGRDDPVLKTRLAGLDLPNCVGLAAGFDKDAEVPDAMLRAGFGFVECGTVTPEPQPGNPRPRLFRLTEDGAVINRYGFNSQGLLHFGQRLAWRQRRGVVGANIGANKDSSDRIDDYVVGLRALWQVCDYFTANISSPNTPGLRGLQSRAALDDLLGRLDEARRDLEAEAARPVFLKVAPDLSEPEVRDVVEACLAHRIDALVVGNTTLSRPDSLSSAHRGEAGGLSGRPLMALSTRVLGQAHDIAAGRLPLVGCGGVASGADAYAKVRAGACAIQLYTAMALQGPGVVGRIKRELAALLKADGFSHVGEACGADRR
jgi:dihydroorotate dehydrogenase